MDEAREKYGKKYRSEGRTWTASSMNEKIGIPNQRKTIKCYFRKKMYTNAKKKIEARVYCR